MSVFDICLLIIIAGFTLSGLFKGLIKLLGHMVGLIVGAYVASHFYLVFYEWGKSLAGGHDNIGKIVAFIILFVVVTRLMDLIFFLIEKFFNFLAFIPGSKYINNILGAALGLIEGSLFLGLIIYVISRYTLISNFFGQQLSSSIVAPWLLKIVNIMLPILPEALKAIKSII